MELIMRTSTFYLLVIAFSCALTSCNSKSPETARTGSIDAGALHAEKPIDSSVKPSTIEEPAQATQALSSPVPSGEWQYAVGSADGSGAHGASILNSDLHSGLMAGSIELKFDDDPSHGRAAYLQWTSTENDFECGTDCKVRFKANNGPFKVIDASESENAVSRLTLNEPEMLWNEILHTRNVEFEFPVKSSGGKITAGFDVSGAKPDWLPGWN